MLCPNTGRFLPYSVRNAKEPIVKDRKNPSLLLLGSLVTSATMHEGQFFARVALPSLLKDPLIYSIPRDLNHQIYVGSRVLVPLQRRTVTGVVWEIIPKNPLEEAKAIIATLDDTPILDAQLLRLCQWIAQYYLAPLGEVLSTMLPPTSRRESKRIVIFKSAPVQLHDELSRKVVDVLRERKSGFAVKAFQNKFRGQNIERVLARLATVGVVEIIDRIS